MVNKNFRSGTAFEARFIAKLLKEDKAIKAGRFYASKGITDVWWVSPQGVHHEAQLKFSKNKPYIHPQELKKLQEFADKVSGMIGVWLITKQSRKPIEMKVLN